VTADTQREVKRLAAVTLLELGELPSQRLDVAEMVAMYLDAGRDRLAPTTYESYVKLVDKLPAGFMRQEIVDVDARSIRLIYEQLVADGMSPHTVRRMHALLGAAWTMAQRWGYDQRNPVRFVSPPKGESKEISAPTPEDVATLLDGCSDSQHRLFIKLAAATGARRGELCGLQWRDIDFNARQLVVRRSITHTTEAKTVVRDTKTGAKGHRVLAVGDEVMRDLRRWRTNQVEMALAAGLPDPVWVLSHDAGVTPWKPDHITKWFMRLRDRLGLSTRVHDLRHFAATQLLAAGVPMSQVSGRLGHADMATTAKRYAHFVQADDRRAADILDRLVFPK
jgi:integrase